jgi:hypothetical protein
MNRLSPLIVRRVGRFAPPASYEAAIAEDFGEGRTFEDLKLFALSWVGGMVFFWTYFS